MVSIRISRKSDLTFSETREGTNWLSLAIWSKWCNRLSVNPITNYCLISVKLSPRRDKMLVRQTNSFWPRPQKVTYSQKENLDHNTEASVSTNHSYYQRHLRPPWRHNRLDRRGWWDWCQLGSDRTNWQKSVNKKSYKIFRKKNSCRKSVTKLLTKNARTETSSHRRSSRQSTQLDSRCNKFRPKLIAQLFKIIGSTCKMFRIAKNKLSWSSDSSLKRWDRNIRHHKKGCFRTTKWLLWMLNSQHFRRWPRR